MNTISYPMGKNLTPWIIDTDSMHHITYSLSNFSKYKRISHFIMKMPNGQTTNTTISGIVLLSSNITLENVDYIHSFTVNLLYVT